MLSIFKLVLYSIGLFNESVNNYVTQMNNNNLTSVIILVGGSGSRFSKLNEQPKQLSKLIPNACPAP